MFLLRLHYVLALKQECKKVWRQSKQWDTNLIFVNHIFIREMATDLYFIEKQPQELSGT